MSNDHFHAFRINLFAATCERPCLATLRTSPQSPFALTVCLYLQGLVRKPVASRPLTELHRTLLPRRSQGQTAIYTALSQQTLVSNAFWEAKIAFVDHGDLTSDLVQDIERKIRKTGFDALRRYQAVVSAEIASR